MNVCTDVLCEAVNYGQDPLLASYCLVELPHQIVVVLENLTNAEHERLSGKGTSGWWPRLYVEQLHGVDKHVPRQGIGEVVRAGIVVILYLVLLQNLTVLLLRVLRAVTAQLEQLQRFGGLHLEDLVS